MKKIYLILLVAFAMLNTHAQNTCANAVPITSVPFSSGTLTTCGAGNDYAAGSLFNANYGGGEDYVFSINIANAPVSLTLALGGTAVYKIASVHSACPPASANALGGVVTSTGTTGTATVAFPANGTYYIIVDTWPDPTCGNFTLNITQAAAAPANDICSGAITVPVSSTCTPTTYNTLGATDNNETGDCSNGTETAVWFKFVATQTSAVVSVTGSATFDAVVGVTTGCGSATTPTGGACTDETLSGEAEILNLSGLTVGNTYYIQVYDYQGDATETSAFDLCVVSSTCPTPAGTAVAGVTSTGANVSWTGSGTFIVEYGPAGFTPGTGATAGTNGTVINPATSPQAIAGLTASSAYDVYIRQVCAGAVYSLNTAAVSFTTPCAISNIPYTMPIEATADFGLPACTSTQDANGDFNTWYTYSDLTGWTGSFLVYEYSETSSANDWIYTNGLNLTGGTTYRLTFKYNNDGSVPADGTDYYPEKLKVGYGTSASAAGMTNILANYPTVANVTPQTATLDFTPSSDGVYYIGFQAYSDANQDVLLLDDITVDVAPACAGVSGVTAGSVTATTASISWAGTGTFILEYGPAGFVPGTGATAGVNGTVINPATSPQTLSLLTPLTTYDVYIRRDCSAGTYSDNSPVISFTTFPIQFLSATSGNWSAPATWANGTVPTCADNVFIAAGHTVTVNNTGNVSNTLTINTGATLAVTGGEVTVGCTDRNSRFVNNGTLNVSAGSLRVNGSVFIPNGSSFAQSGGTFTVDGNNGGDALTSVPLGTPIFAIGSAASAYGSGALNLTGGTLLITDPHAAATGDAFTYYGANNAAYNINTGASYTLKFGDGVSTDAGGSALGFLYNQWQENSIFNTSVVFDGGTGTNRKFTSQYSPCLFQNLTILSNEFNAPTLTNVQRDLSVNAGAIMTMSTAAGSALVMSAGDVNPATFTFTQVANPVAQSISGTGTIRNAATSPTANVLGLTINSAPGAGVTLNRPISLSTTLTLTSGSINTSATNLLTVGTSPTVRGTITRTSGMVVGPISKWFGTLTGSTTLPVGTGSNYKPAIVNFTVAPTTGGTITAAFSGTAPVFSNATPLTEGALTVNYASRQGSWFLDAGNGLAGGTYSASFNGTGATDVIDYTKTVLIKRPTGGGDWVLNGTHVATTGSNTAPVVSRTGMSGFSEFAIGGELLVALPITIEYFNGVKQAGGNVLNWKVNSTEPTISLTLERSADGINYTAINSQSATSARCLQPFSYSDVSDQIALVYYRLKVVETTGKVTYSNIVLLTGKGKRFELSGIQPNPVRGEAFLNVSSANTEKMEVTITDVAGKIVSKQTISLITGLNKIPMNFTKLASGTYQVSGKSADGTIKTIRFVKQ